MRVCVCFCSCHATQTFFPGQNHFLHWTLKGPSASIEVNCCGQSQAELKPSIHFLSVNAKLLFWWWLQSIFKQKSHIFSGVPFVRICFYSHQTVGPFFYIHMKRIPTHTPSSSRWFIEKGWQSEKGHNTHKVTHCLNTAYNYNDIHIALEACPWSHATGSGQAHNQEVSVILSL